MMFCANASLSVWVGDSFYAVRARLTSGAVAELEASCMATDGYTVIATEGPDAFRATVESAGREWSEFVALLVAAAQENEAA